MQKLGDYIKEYSARNKQNEDIPVYSVTNSNGFCRDYFGKEVASSNKKTYKIVPRNAFAYNPSRINVGSVDYQHYEDRVIVSPLYNVFTVDERVVPEYLYFYLKNPNTIKRIKAVASGSVRDNLKLSMLYEFPISLPSVSDQKTIVKTINKVQAVINSKKSALEKLDNLIKARFVEMFGDEKCELLQDLSEKVTDGSHMPPKGVDKSKYMMLSSQNIFNELNFDGIRYLSKEDFENENKRTSIQNGDVLITIVGTIGRTHVVKNNEKFVFQRSVGVIKPIHEKLNGVYLSAFLQTNKARSFLDSGAHGSSQKGICLQDLKKLPVPVAPIDKQNQFADFVAQVDKSKFAITQSLLYLTKIISDSFIPHSGQISVLLSSRDSAG